jgi:hypothetical protein
MIRFVLLKPSPKHNEYNFKFNQTSSHLFSSTIKRKIVLTCVFSSKKYQTSDIQVPTSCTVQLAHHGAGVSKDLDE